MGVERGPGRRYPLALKARMIAWARRAVARGASATATAKELGVDPRALAAWLRDAQGL